MRLINCSTLQLEEFFGENVPQYAILSHTWGDEEVTFADLPLGQSTTTSRAGYGKIEFTCAQAILDGLNYAWIDTCCIDKSSSSELSEAINSMFAWYRESTCCYAYLPDVLVASMEGSFAKSRWFTRGWTLQELIAPKDVIFYDQQWNKMGKRSEHAEWISKITEMDTEVLLQPRKTFRRYFTLDSFCVAKKMSWMSHRETTRREDMAYCLLGIFDVNMPLLYGEGDRAFIRLQEEIMKRTDDDSILAWDLEPEMNHPLGLVSRDVKLGMASEINETDVLASSPKQFSNCANLRYTSGSTSPFLLTNIGLQIQLPLYSVYQPDDYFSPGGNGWIGLLSCSSSTSQEFLGIPLVPATNNYGPRVQRMTRVFVPVKEGIASTLVVGPKAAVKSVPGTITISRYGIGNLAEEYYKGHQQIVVKESKILRNLGYRVKNVERTNITQRNGDVHGCDPIWNPETLVLTMEHEATPDYGKLMEFCFERSWNEQNSTFTIFMHTLSSRFTVREGDTFSKDDKRRFCNDLRDRSAQDNINDILIPGGEGNMFNVSAKIRTMEVYRHRMFEVIVKAAKVVNSTD